MTNYIFAALAGAFATGQSTLTKLAPGDDGQAYIMRFNTVKVGTAFLFFFIISLHSLSFHFHTLLFSIIYGAVLFFSTLFGYLALSCGSLSLTSTIVSYSVVIPCVWGVIFLREDINAIKILGFILLFASLIMLKKQTESKTFSKKWLLYVALTFLCNGAMSIIQKLHQTYFNSLYHNEFTTYSMFACFLLFVTSLLFCKKNNSSKRANAKYAAPAGMLMGLNNYLTLTLSSKFNASVLFPTISIFQVLFNLTFSRAIFKEKLTFFQISGIALGVISVLLIK